ncbi:MAG: hypothetical protein HY963_04415 [Ignavibacteriales bacterium]|nr:hypothetical protein [Ignavibacteriales bacterium]
MSRKKYFGINFLFMCQFVIFFILTNGFVSGQISNIVSTVRVSDAKEQMPITISAELFSSENISVISIAYKSFGQTEFRKAEMIIKGVTATVSIPAEAVAPPYLEYYLFITMRDGSSQTYPVGIQEGVPSLQIAVSAFSEKDKEILVLSPSVGEILTQQELMISVSFIKAPDNVDASKTKIYINNEDVSSKAVYTGDILVVSGENLSGELKIGPGLLRIDIYDKKGNLYHTISRNFRLISTELAAGAFWSYNGSLKGESRSEQFNSQSTWYNNITADINAETGNWSINGNAYITSEEVSDQQPYNRYSLSLKGGDWLELQAGDAFPRFPNLIMDGKRIRGFNGSLNFGFLNIQTAYGETERSIEGKLIEKFTADDPATLESDVIPINAQRYVLPYGRVELGTFKRKVLAVRPSFGNGENFQLGFSYLHSKDDAGSIEFGARPEEDLVLGTDFMLAYDSRNIMFTTQAAVSLSNKDISSGTLTDKQIDEIFGSNSNFSIDPSDVKRIRDLIGNFITVNQYLGPWNPQEFASLAAEAALTLNYFNNNVKASYIYRGNDFQSFGQSFLRTDVKGINIVDRIRMIDNKLFLSIGYEELKDNLQKTKVATTTFQTINASISLFPRADFPNITLGYTRNANNNGLSLSDPLNKMYIVDDITNRIMLQLSYDFNALVKHNSSLSFSTSSKDDKSLLNMDTKFTTGSLNLTSYWTQQLSSLFGLVYNQSEFFGKQSNYYTITIGGRYKLLEKKLQLSATLSPSFGDFKRQTFEFIADYNVITNLNLMFQARIFRIPGASTNSIIGLVTRLTI